MRGDAGALASQAVEDVQETVVELIAFDLVEQGVDQHVVGDVVQPVQGGYRLLTVQVDHRSGYLQALGREDGSVRWPVSGVQLAIIGPDRGVPGLGVRCPGLLPRCRASF